MERSTDDRWNGLEGAINNAHRGTYQPRKALLDAIAFTLGNEPVEGVSLAVREVAEKQGHDIYEGSITAFSAEHVAVAAFTHAPGAYALPREEHGPIAITVVSRRAIENVAVQTPGDKVVRYGDEPLELTAKYAGLDDPVIIGSDASPPANIFHRLLLGDLSRRRASE